MTRSPSIRAQALGRVLCKKRMRRYYPGAPTYADSQVDVTETDGGRTVHRHNAFAVVRFTTDAASFVVEGIPTQVNGQEQFGVYVNGAYFGNVSMPIRNVVKQQAVALPGTKGQVVELWEGPQLDNGGGDFRGSYALSVRGDVVLAPPSTPSTRVVVYGDSITCGYGGAIFCRDGWFPLMRAAKPGRSNCEAWGGRSIGNEADINALATRLVAHVAGSTTRQIVLFIGTNDFGQSTVVATFQSRYAALLDAIHGADATAAIWCVHPLFRTDETTPNSVGATLASYRSAITTVTGTRGWTTNVTGSATWLGSGDMAGGDGIHPPSAGHVKVFNNMKTTLGF